MGTLKLNTTSGGSLSIQAADGASDNTLTLPAVTGGNIVTTADSGTITQGMIGSGVAGSGPTFFAYHSAAYTYTFSGSYITSIFDSTEWNVDSCYDTSTGRFSPAVAGYYQLNAYVQVVATRNYHPAFFKNGSGWIFGGNDSNSVEYGTAVNGLVYLNGSSDYVTHNIYINSTVDSSTGRAVCYFSGHLVRAA